MSDDDRRVEVEALAELLHETAEHHGAFEAAAPDHDWWDWYAPYLDARMQGRTPDEAEVAADRHMATTRQIVRGDGRATTPEPARDRPTSPWGPLGTILVGTDGSPAALEAVAFAVALAAEHEAQIEVVHVVPVVDLVTTFDEDAYGQPHEPTEQDHAPLEAAAALAAARGVVATTSLLGGRTVAEIVAHGDARDVDLIVIGSSGHSAITSTVLGRVSRGVLRKANRPVLIVRGRRGRRTGRDPAGAAEASASTT